MRMVDNARIFYFCVILSAAKHLFFKAAEILNEAQLCSE